jgi:hypothetical protein
MRQLRQRSIHFIHFFALPLAAHSLFFTSQGRRCYSIFIKNRWRFLSFVFWLQPKTSVSGIAVLPLAETVACAHFYTTFFSCNVASILAVAS